MLLDSLAYYFVGLEVLLFSVAVLIFLSSLDDFFIDICFIVRSTYRRWIVMPRYRRMTVDDLDLPEQQWTAILVPAWHEGSVIGLMLSHLLDVVDYDHYTVFVGVYPNDPETLAAVRDIAQNAPRVRIVQNPGPGPTNKGDCLDAILRGMHLMERETGIHHKIVVLHDAEDIVHPLELKIFNKLIPRKDMVQLPVVPLEAPLWGLTAGHYMDEFAEHHTKDLAIREALTGAVPSAGVGCGFSREVFTTLAFMTGNVFGTGSLTEDYEIAMRLQSMGKKLIFVRFFVDRLEPRGGWFGVGKPRRRRELVGTREYFPKELHGSYRQKARWLIGIAFQAWREFGWRGPLMVKYAFFRDRKAILTSQINILAYVVVISLGGMTLMQWLYPNAYRFPPLVESGSALHYLLVANAFFLFNRVFQRAAYVYRTYGPAHAAMSPIRLIWGNFINFFASSYAIWLFAKGALTGTPVHWIKTEHRFPTPTELKPHRQRLGEFLLERRLTDHKALTRALREQQSSHKPIGEILVARGDVAEEEMLKAVAIQCGLDYMQTLPPDAGWQEKGYPAFVQKDRPVLPVRQEADALIVASYRLLAQREIAALESSVGRPIRQVLCPRGEIERHAAAPERAEA